MAELHELLSLDIRIGTVVSARRLRGALKPAYQLSVSFGPLGTRTAHVEITDLYDVDDLVGLQVVAVVNLPARKVAGVESQAVVLCVDAGKGENVLVIPERPLPDGRRLA